MDDHSSNDWDPQEIVGWAEFCSWSALVMTPIIWWLQGPSVSTEQFVVRTALVVIAASASVVLRARVLIRRHRARHETLEENDALPREKNPVPKA
jgi:hypothetical protein